MFVAASFAAAASAVASFAVATTAVVASVDTVDSYYRLVVQVEIDLASSGVAASTVAAAAFVTAEVLNYYNKDYILVDKPFVGY